jgi:hypothetical protein
MWQISIDNLETLCVLGETWRDGGDCLCRCLTSLIWSQIPKGWWYIGLCGHVTVARQIVGRLSTTARPTRRGFRASMGRTCRQARQVPQQSTMSVPFQVP